MALALNVKVGDTLEIEHANEGFLGTIRLDHKASNAVRMIIDMPRTVLVRVMDHRANGITWGLSSRPHAPLKAAAI